MEMIKLRQAALAMLIVGLLSGDAQAADTKPQFENMGSNDLFSYSVRKQRDILGDYTVNWKLENKYPLPLSVNAVIADYVCTDGQKKRVKSYVSRTIKPGETAISAGERVCGKKQTTTSIEVVKIIWSGDKDVKAQCDDGSNVNFIVKIIGNKNVKLTSDKWLITRPLSDFNYEEITGEICKDVAGAEKSKYKTKGKDVLTVIEKALHDIVLIDCEKNPELDACRCFKDPKQQGCGWYRERGRPTSNGRRA